MTEAGYGIRAPWRVVIADDDSYFRRMVRMLLEDDPDFEVVGEAGDGRAAVEMADRLQPDSVILDMRMPVMDGHAALAQIKRLCPDTDVIALSALAWVSGAGPAPDAALEKGQDAWMQMLPALVATLGSDRRARAVPESPRAESNR